MRFILENKVKLIVNRQKLKFVIRRKTYEDRHRASTVRHFHNNSSEKTIPFAFTIKLPPPQYERVIISRDYRGRITRSVPT